VGDVETRLKQADRLFPIADRHGLQMFNEWDLTTERFKKETYDQLHAEKAQ